ncbi:hypothetical protein FD04_GL001476 [Secundilactobacillus odoratitofui DSM 19909 = JCM 15043]|uniref:Acetyl-CoA carboxylase n=1 Tax=Secundilactobacillus odoratitofui DSM 19909 = JCM 15043 TaxID=1423776 RepID=A0A0R1LYC2_9LACO|nr:hypothetical protein [Secundilactobacillus odoratitofui]KRK97450.1 hypothetical protein FD04_GL001476 [Secundilactobacillus odoratitofui DSM 19909 = JCM 15043]
MNEDLRYIEERLDAGFTRRMQTRYQIMVTNDPYDQTFNFFLNSQRRNQWQKSLPLHSVTTYRLAYLEALLEQLRKHTQLTFLFVGFTGQRWPSNQQFIQRRRLGDE